MRFISRTSVFVFARRFASEVKTGAEAVELPLTSTPFEGKELDRKEYRSSKHKITQSPSEYRESHAIFLKQNLERWISNQQTFPKGDENDFEIFNKLHHNPIRKNVPEYPESISGLKFQESTESDRENVLSYFKELTRFSYPKKEKFIAKAIKQVYKKYRSLKTVQDEYLCYSVKKNNGESVTRLLKNKPIYYQRPSTYSTLLEMTSIFKNSKNSLASLRSITKRLDNNNIPISNELVYKLYYMLPIDASRFMVKQLEDKMDVRTLLNDVPYLRIESFDEMKQKLLLDEVKFTYASYIQLSKLMTRENRIAEGLNFIQRLVFMHRLELPLSLCKYTVDLVLAHDPHLCVPFAVSMQRFTGCSLKMYAAYRATVLLLASKVLTKETITLFKLLVASSTWKVKIFTNELLQHISESDNRGELLEFFASSIEDADHAELKRVFQTFYASNDIAFKPGFDASFYEPIYRLFPTYKKFDIMRTEVFSDNKDLRQQWEATIVPYASSNKPLFYKFCREVGATLVERGEYEKVVPFVQYVKNVHDCNIEYDTYLGLFLKLVSLDEPNTAQIQLAILLAHYVNLRRTMMVKAFLDKYPTTDEVFAALENDKASKNLDQAWALLVKETAWPLDGPPAL